MAGLGVVGFFLKEVHDVATENDPEIDPYDRGDYGRYEFYLYATSVGVIIGIIGLVAVLTGMIEKNCGALTVSNLCTCDGPLTQYNDIYRGYYTAARRYEVYLRVVKIIFNEWAQRMSNILF